MRQLAQRFGIPVPEMETGDGARDERRRARVAAQDARIATAYFREQLESAPAARIRQYLLEANGASRADTVARLQIGYAPPGRDALRQRLVKSGFVPALLVAQWPGLAARRWE